MFLKRASAILTGRFIGKTYKEYQSKCIEDFQSGKQIDEFLDKKKIQKRPRAPKPFFWDRNLKNLETRFQILKKNEKYIKDAPTKTVLDGSSTFANELMRFRNNAKPIWVEIQKHCKNAVRI